MSDATHGLPVYEPNPDFGRPYGRVGEKAPSFELPHGWWIVPSVVLGALGWILLFKAVFF